MKDYLKNLFAARGAAFWLNLLGLSLAFVIFYVLMAEVMWHVTFDRFHKDADRVCQVFHRNKKFDEAFKEFGIRDEQDTYIASFMEEIVKSSQQFESHAGIYYLDGEKEFIPVENEGAEPLMANIRYSTPELFNVFSFDLLEGDTAAFRDSHNVFISSSLAKKLFGEADSYVGRQCRVKGLWDKHYTEVNVGAVYRDFPTNSHMENEVYRCLSEQQQDELWKDEGSWNHCLFVKLREGAESEAISEELLANSTLLRETASHFTFIPLHDVYFIQNEHHKDDRFEDMFFGKRNGNETLVWALTLVALLVIVIAAINYVNFAMAMVPYQIKEVNVRRILGAKSASLRWKMLKTAVFNTLMAITLSMLLMNVIIHLGFLNDLLKCDLAFAKNGETLLIMLALMMLLPVVAGCYPAWYLTTRKPALVINGNFALSPAGQMFRRVLIAFQFTVSLVILLVLLLFSAQHYYIRTSSVGYDRDLVVYVEVSEDYLIKTHRFKWFNYLDPMMQAIKSSPAISEVSWSSAVLGQDQFQGWGREHNGRNIAFNAEYSGYNFLTTVGIKVTEGRNFRAEDEDKDVAIFNEAARQQFGLKLHDVVGNHEIVGFMENIHHKSLRNEISPMAICSGGGQGSNFVVRVASPSKVDEAIRFIDEQNQKISEGQCKLTYCKPDDVLGQAYANEMKQLKLLLVGAIVSLLIPLIGVFGLVLFETRAKRKEIGIRKVFGATTRGILVMFNMQYLRTLMVCFILAAPVAYTFYNRWIESFAYRTPMHWWLFGVAFLIVAIVVCLTVTVQSWRAAKERPVETIMK